jgi:hypothetical protein
MKIQWTKPVEIEVVENIDEAEILETSNVLIKIDEINDVDIIDEQANCVSMQFGNGSVAYGVSRNWFRELRLNG